MTSQWDKSQVPYSAEVIQSGIPSQEITNRVGQLRERRAAWIPLLCDLDWQKTQYEIELALL